MLSSTAKSFRLQRVGVFLLAFAGLIPISCKTEPPLELVPVKGKVTVDGKALTSGNVSLRPADPSTAPAAMSAGKIDSSGNYEVFTGGKSGAPKIKFKFVVTQDMVPTDKGMPELTFNKKFADPNTTPHVFDVVDSPKEGAYDLKLTK